MYNSLQITECIQQLYAMIGCQNDKIARQEKMLEALQNEIAAHKGRPPIHIERIEYKFDQLKVERLDGTLTIGVSPVGVNAIEDMNINGKSLDGLSPQTVSEEVWEIWQEIQRFLDEEARNEIQQLETRYKSNLSADFHSRMIEDVRKQLDQRLQYYVNQTDPAAAENGAPFDKARITGKLKQDIRLALNNYYVKLSGKDREA